MKNKNIIIMMMKTERLYLRRKGYVRSIVIGETSMPLFQHLCTREKCRPEGEGKSQPSSILLLPTILFLNIPGFWLCLI